LRVRCASTAGATARLAVENAFKVSPTGRRTASADKESMKTLGVILARAGSKGLPDKCVRPILGRPMIDYTIDHGLAARTLCDLILSTDSAAARRRATDRGLTVIDRPAALADDTATIDAAARHAVEAWEALHGARVDAVCILYANIPVRAAGAIDRAVAQLRDSGASSVRSVAPIGKHHPDWLHRLDGDRMRQFRTNSIHRRQDLEPLFYHDGAILVVTRTALFDARRVADDAQGFLGDDRRAMILTQTDAVDVDEAGDLALAEAILAGAAPRGMSIGGRRIGPGATYVIAEAGVNHNGDVDEALRLVDAAVRAGADAVKFQIFDATRLTTASAATASYQRSSGAGSSQRALLRDLELSDAAFRRIREYCRKAEIEFLATPFSTFDLERLMRLEPAAIKFASTDINHYPLLEMASRAGKPLILSTGAATEDEIGEAVSWLRGWGATFALLHCISRYPTPVDELNLRAVTSLARRFGVIAGLSDHTTSAATGALAVAAGACIIEKHLTLDRSAAGPDHRASLDPDLMRAYIHNIRDAEAIMGDGGLGQIEEQRDVRTAARKSVVAARDIEPGQTLQPSDLEVKRPAGGIEPSRISRVIGRTARTPIPAETPLRWDMLT